MLDLSAQLLLDPVRKVGSSAMKRKYISGTVVLLLVSGCLSFDCQNNVKRHIDSPDGSSSAVVFQRNCGATTREDLQISILKPGETPTDGGNAFIADYGNERTPNASRDSAIKVSWSGPKELLITTTNAVRVFKSEGRVGDVTVRVLKSQ